MTATIPHFHQQEPTDLTVRSIYQENVRFVLVALGRLGVDRADLGDLAHDVFVVVHRRLHTFNHTSRMTTWLFGICMGLAANYRRRRDRTSTGTLSRAYVEAPDVEIPADELLARREAKVLAERVLAELSAEKRAVFVMFEVEDFSCSEIAEQIGVPVGTVYSRLHSARADIQRIVSRRATAEKSANGA